MKFILKNSIVFTFWAYFLDKKVFGELVGETYDFRFSILNFSRTGISDLKFSVWLPCLISLNGELKFSNFLHENCPLFLRRVEKFYPIDLRRRFHNWQILGKKKKLCKKKCEEVRVLEYLLFRIMGDKAFTFPANSNLVLHEFVIRNGFVEVRVISQ